MSIDIDWHTWNRPHKATYETCDTHDWLVIEIGSGVTLSIYSVHDGHTGVRRSNGLSREQLRAIGRILNAEGVPDEVPEDDGIPEQAPLQNDVEWLEPLDPEANLSAAT